MNLKLHGVVLAVFLLSSGSLSALAQSNVNFAVPGPADWNDPSSWDINDVPGGTPADPFPDDVAGISNSGTAFLDSAAQAPIDGLILGEDQVGDQLGTLEIRDGGSLVVTASGGGALNGAVLVGQGGGTGILDMRGASSLDADTLAVAGAGGSTLRVAENAAVNVGGDVTLSRGFLMSGPDVTFDVGEELTISGNFGYEITGPTGSTVAAPFGNANLSGTLTITLSGYTPSLGESWTVIDAAGLSGQFAVIDAPTTVVGMGFDVSHDAAAGDVTVSVGNRLVLTVNRVTGAAAIGNLFGDTDMKGYTISSPSGRLDSGAWSSLDDQMIDANLWHEANPTMNNLSELNLLGMSNIAAGGELPIGSPYDTVPAALGDVVPEDLTFEYATADGQTKTGFVVYEEDVRINNVLLTVDPVTGQAAISNPSFFEVDINGYVISSPSGSLDAAGWNSLDDQGLSGDLWFEANPTSENLSELSLEGKQTLAIGSQFLLGSPLAAGGMQDLTFQFNRVGVGPMFGVVEYGPIPSAGLPGDTNNDGKIDIDDLNNVRNNFGTMGEPDGSLAGDAFPFDGMVNIDDLNAVRNNFGAMPAPVPEPGGISLCCLAMIGVLNLIGRRRQFGI